MAKTLSVLEFESAINSILAEYKGLVDEDVEQVTKAVGKRTVQNVQTNITTAGIHGTGDYKESISVRNSREDARNLHKSVVYAKGPHYRLTHLLEYGHAVVTVGGRTPGPGKKRHVDARPHWEGAERQAINEYETRLKEAIERK